MSNCSINAPITAESLDTDRVIHVRLIRLPEVMDLSAVSTNGTDLRL